MIGFIKQLNTWYNIHRNELKYRMIIAWIAKCNLVHNHIHCCRFLSAALFSVVFVFLVYFRSYFWEIKVYIRRSAVTMVTHSIPLIVSGIHVPPANTTPVHHLPAGIKCRRWIQFLTILTSRDEDRYFDVVPGWVNGLSPMISWFRTE